ncbi:MAG: CDP-alcohol phosphatidyltransferase family protein [Sphingomicrobium sp.]
MPDEHSSTDLRARSTAWAVHLFTATGVVFALLAMVAVLEHRWTTAMLWLFAAFIVDGVDGTFARIARVNEVAPRIDGAALDLVTDYLTYVFIPAFFILEARLLPVPLALPLAALILVSSLYVFARRDMKTDDGYFRGFPALWNLVALYLYAAGLGETASAAVVAVLIVLTFAPVHVVHPLRVRDYGCWLATIASVWAGSTVALLMPQLGSTGRSVLLAISAATALLLIAMGLLRTVRGRRLAETTLAP